MTPIVLEVFGLPQPQGSKTAFVRAGRAVLVEGRRTAARAQFAMWRQAVQTAASDWLRSQGAPAPLDVPLRVSMVFHLPRPRSTPRRVVWPAKRPDLDKLTRAVFDALTGLLFTDDSRICAVEARKVFAADRPAGCTVCVEVLGPVSCRDGLVMSGRTGS